MFEDDVIIITPKNEVIRKRHFTVIDYMVDKMADEIRDEMDADIMRDLGVM